MISLEFKRYQEIKNVECPFCKKETVKAIYYPPVLQIRKSRSTATGTKTKFYHTKEKVGRVEKARASNSYYN
jgi:hypothetical protein